MLDKSPHLGLAWHSLRAQMMVAWLKQATYFKVEFDIFSNADSEYEVQMNEKSQNSYILLNSKVQTILSQ